MKIREFISRTISCNLKQKCENSQRKVVKEKREHEGSPLLQYVAGFFGKLCEKKLIILFTIFQ